MSLALIRCTDCGAEILGGTPGIASARWREHVIAVHTGDDS